MAARFCLLQAADRAMTVKLQVAKAFMRGCGIIGINPMTAETALSVFYIG